MFKFSKSTDESIQQSFIAELLDGIKTYDVELSSALASVESAQCLDNFIIKELTAIGEDSSALNEAKKYLGGKLSGEIVFWEEDDIHEQVLMWKISKSSPVTSPKPEPDPDDDNNGGDGWSDGSGESSGSSSAGEGSGETIQILRTKAKEKVEANKDNSEKLYQMLMLLADRYSNVLKDIDEFL